MIELTNIICFDVDQTLVRWRDYNHNTKPMVNSDGTTVFFEPFDSHIKYLKQLKEKGHTILVWSKAGKNHAKRIVTILELNDFVDVVADKPSCYFDDVPVEKWIGPRIFVDIGGEVTNLRAAEDLLCLKV